MIKNWLLLRLFSKPNTVSTLYLQGLSKQSNSVKDVKNFPNKELSLIIQFLQQQRFTNFKTDYPVQF
jgi:hypothetical protein